MNEPSLILDNINALLKNKDRVLIAIDGRCAAGKTTLAKRLNEEIGCAVFHIDDFFLRPEQRTEERYKEPGGNFDRERFFAEVLTPLLKNEPFSFRPYDCKAQALAAPIFAEPRKLTVIEGSYSCHPSMWEYYDLRIFLTVDNAEQLRRIEHRNGSGALAVFREKWIPLEERYFKAFDLENRCDLIIGN